jgi:hypothetical protein
MENSCYRCGHAIEEGKPFCAQCGAPQIRVTMPESTPPPVAGTVSSNNHSTPTIESSGFRRPPSLAALSGDVEWRRALRFCVVAALVAVIVMSLRLVGPLPAVLGAGFLSVILYYRSPLLIASARSGAKIGAVTGLLSSLVPALFFAIFVALLRSGGELRQEMLDSLQQFASRSNNPQVQATFDLLKTPEGINKLVLAMVGFLLISVVAGSLAGALTGAALTRRNQRR